MGACISKPSTREDSPLLGTGAAGPRTVSGLTAAQQVGIAVTCTDVDAETVKNGSRRFEAELAVRDSGAWRTVGTSEQVTLEAGQLQFGRSFEVHFAFGAEQRLRMTVRAVGPADTYGEELGFVELALAQLVCAPEQQLAQRFRSQRLAGASCSVQATVSSNKQSRVRAELAARILPQGRRAGKRLQVVVSSEVPGGGWQEVLRTEEARGLAWRPFETSAAVLCDGDYDRRLRLELLALNPEVPAGSAAALQGSSLGSATTTINELQQREAASGAVHTFDLPLEAPGEIAGSPASLEVRGFVLRRRPAFLDYIARGARLGWLVAVDFTQPPGGQGLQEQMLLSAFGTALEDYGACQEVPIWGFGDRVVPLNGNSFQPEVRGLQGMLDLQRAAARIMRFEAPAQPWAPILSAAIGWMEGHTVGREQFYAVLLLLANTPPTDLEAVMQLLQRPEAAVPLTVLVVGNGTEGYGPLQAALEQRDPSLGGQGIPCHMAPWDAVSDPDGSRVASQLLGTVPRDFLSHFRVMRVLPRGL